MARKLSGTKTKERLSICLHQDTNQYLGLIADNNGLSKSELIERISCYFINFTNFDNERIRSLLELKGGDNNHEKASLS